MLFGEFPIKEDLETSSLFDAETIGWITGLKCSQNSKKQWDILSTDLQDLLGFMLSMDADTRPSIDEALEWEWLNDYFDAWSPQEIYEEMEQRKQFIIDNKNS